MKKSQTQKDKSCMLSLICRILKSQTHENSVLLEASGEGGRGSGRYWPKRINLQLNRINKFWRSNTQNGNYSWWYCVVYLKFTENWPQVFSRHTHAQPCEVMEVLTSLIMVIIPQCILLSKHWVVRLKCIQLFVNYISIKLRKIKLV